VAGADFSGIATELAPQLAGFREAMYAYANLALAIVIPLFCMGVAWQIFRMVAHVRVVTSFFGDDNFDDDIDVSDLNFEQQELF
jgi:hypothetical protein